MADRRAHLVGSLPGPDARTAMTTALDVLGPYLRSLPDGETGERRNWVGSAIEGLAAHPDLEPRGPALGEHPAVLRVRRGHHLYGATMDLGHVAAARQNHPVFLDVRASNSGRQECPGQRLRWPPSGLSSAGARGSCSR